MERMDSEIKDLTEFDNTIRGLFNLSKNVIKTHEKHNLNLSSRQNPILTRLERYIKFYDRTDAEEHTWYFIQVYSKNRSAILRGPDNDRWLREGSVTIHFGEEVNRPIRNAMLHLSIIYNTSCKVRDDTQDHLDGLPDVDQNVELIYPDLYLLYLYSIFYELSDSEDDKKKLGGYIGDLEKVTGKKNSKRNTSSKPAEGLDGMLNAATGMMEQFGIKMPEGQKMPSGSDLTNVLNNALQNPQTKSMFGNMVKDLQECNNVGDLVGKLVGNLGSIDPSMKETLQKNFGMATGGEGSEGSEGTEGMEPGMEGEGDYEPEFIDDGEYEPEFLDE